MTDYRYEFTVRVWIEDYGQDPTEPEAKKDAKGLADMILRELKEGWWHAEISEPVLIDKREDE